MVHRLSFEIAIDEDNINAYSTRHSVTMPVFVKRANSKAGPKARAKPRPKVDAKASAEAFFADLQITISGTRGSTVDAHCCRDAEDYFPSS